MVKIDQLAAAVTSGRIHEGHNPRATSFGSVVTTHAFGRAFGDLVAFP